MPFQSKAQMRAAFGGYLGSEMKQKADTWAHETPDIKHLPAHKKSKAKGGKKEYASHALKGLKDAKPKEKS